MHIFGIIALWPGFFYSSFCSTSRKSRVTNLKYLTDKQ
jgi:hypothetical protein